MTLTQILQKIKSAFYTKSETDTLLGGKSNTDHNHNSTYLGINAKASSASSADSVAWANVSGRPTAVSSFSNDSGYITGAGSCNYANSSGNADTVDGSHAWQMQTLNASGGVHGSAEWLMQCQFNVDGDYYFKLYCGNKSIGTKVDRASSAGYADSAGSANDPNAVHKSGDEIVGGIKTFDSDIYSTNSQHLWFRHLDGSNNGGMDGSIYLNYSNSTKNVYFNGGSYYINGGYYNGRSENAQYTYWLRTSSHADHLFHTEWDGSYFWTYVTAGDGGYRAVRVARSDSSYYAERSMNNGAFYISGYQIYVG